MARFMGHVKVMVSPSSPDKVFINIVKAITIPFFSKVKSISGDLKIYISVSREKFKTKIRISGKCGNVIVETELRKKFSSVA